MVQKQNGKARCLFYCHINCEGVWEENSSYLRGLEEKQYLQGQTVYIRIRKERKLQRRDRACQKFYLTDRKSQRAGSKCCSAQEGRRQGQKRKSIESYKYITTNKITLYDQGIRISVSNNQNPSSSWIHCRKVSLRE